MAKIKKVYEKSYTVIDNHVIQDTNLSWKAKGLFVYLWSQSDEWNFYEKEVVRHSSDGISGLRSGLAELEKHGYLKRERKRSKGQVKESIWTLSETPNLDFLRQGKPDLEKPKQEKPKLEKPKQENRTLINTNQNKYQDKQVRKETITKSLSKEERERDKGIVKMLLNYLDIFAEQWHSKPIIFSESEVQKLIKAVHGKDIGGLKEAAEKTVVYGEQYPQGYLLTCIKNLPEKVVANEE
ncbi:DNA-binding protein [Lactobacillus johnsonii]|nr:DNA-binding protein [Lactobacillus johnsonii]